jgi:MFS family permease
MVSELTIDHLPHQRAQAFSLLPLMYGLGSIIGPILGGFLSHPVSNYPSIFGNLGFLTDFLIKYPYFLPCFISASICILGLIFGLFYLEETLNVHSKNASADDEEESLLINSSSDSEQQYSTFKTKVQHSPTPTIQDKHTPPSLKESLTPAVVAICVTYGFFALQAVFMDGNYYIY